MVAFECLNKRCNYEEYYKDSDAPHICPDCDGKWYRLRFVKEPKKKRPFVNIAYPDNERWSWSMGVNVQDIPEMTRRYPDREYHPKTGQLRVKNRPHKKQLMKEHKMEEYA